MNWDDFKVVLAITRGGSMSAAARTLNVNQTTVSRRLTSLERDLGTTLFLRSRAACHLTEAGERLVRHAERIESEAMTVKEVKRVAERPFGQVRIATMPWLFNYLIVPALVDFHAVYPGISILAYAGIRARHLDKREAEMALRFEELPRAQEACIPICRVGYSVYARRDAKPDSLPWVGFAEDTIHTELESWQDQRLASQGRAVFQANDAGIVYQSVRTGVGKGLIPDVLAARDPSLRCLSAKRPELNRQLRILVREDMLHVARVRTVVDWLQSGPFEKLESP
jgi:DNA-binding transcriptional LysR family regulator